MNIFFPPLNVQYTKPRNNALELSPVLCGGGTYPPSYKLVGGNKNQDTFPIGPAAGVAAVAAAPPLTNLVSYFAKLTNL